MRACVFDIYMCVCACLICVCVCACLMCVCVYIYVQIADFGEFSAMVLFCFSRVQKYIQAAVFETIDFHHKF